MSPYFALAAAALMLSGCRPPKLVQNTWSSVRQSRVVSGLLGDAKNLEKEVQAELAPTTQDLKDRSQSTGKKAAEVADAWGNKTSETLDDATDDALKAYDAIRDTLLQYGKEAQKKSDV